MDRKKKKGKGRGGVGEKGRVHPQIFQPGTAPATYADNVELPALQPATAAAIDQYLLTAAPTAANLPAAVCLLAQTDGRTGGRTPHRFIDPAPHTCRQSSPHLLLFIFSPFPFTLSLRFSPVPSPRHSLQLQSAVAKLHYSQGLL